MNYHSVRMKKEDSEFLKKNFGTLQNGLAEAIKALKYREEKRAEFMKDLKGRLDKEIIKGAD